MITIKIMNEFLHGPVWTRKEGTGSRPMPCRWFTRTRSWLR